MGDAFTELTSEETPGERSLYEALLHYLPDEFRFWHNIHLPLNGPEVDFVLLHPRFGIFLIEVKDWSLENILELDAHHALVSLGGTPTRIRNPLAQARQAVNALRNAFRKQGRFVHETGAHRGKIRVPINPFAVFSNIYRHEIDISPFRGFAEEKSYLFRDDVIEPPDPQMVEKLLVRNRGVKFKFSLAEAELEELQAAIFPQVSCPSLAPEKPSLDSYQARLAAMPEDKPLYLQGAVGTGKSVILLRRALVVHARRPDWRILLLCFNAAMAAYLRTLAESEEIGEPSGLKDIIEIHDFANWMKGLGLVDRSLYVSRSERWVDKVARAALARISGPSSGRDPDSELIKYDHVIIDEGQDFTPSMLKLVKRMMRPPEVGVTIAYDPNQVLYDDSWCRVDENPFPSGNQREVLRQYRTAPDILRLCLAFLLRYRGYPWDSAEIKRVLNINTFARMYDWFLRRKKPESYYELFGAASYEELLEHARNYVLQLKRDGSRWSDALLLFPMKSLIEGSGTTIHDFPRLVVTDFQRHHIPVIFIGRHRVLGDTRRRVDWTADAVRVANVFQAKGLEATAVLFFGLDNLENIRSFHHEDEEDAQMTHEANLAYVGMTRATHEVVAYYTAYTRPIRILAECARRVFGDVKIRKDLPREFPARVFFAEALRRGDRREDR